MGDLEPVAFDIETSGFGADSVVTVVGFAHDLGTWLGLNTNGQDVDAAALQSALTSVANSGIDVETRANEAAVLEATAGFLDERIDGDTHYLTAYNGETWNGGFDLPYLRTAFLRHDISWPFGDLAYADMMEAIDRFDTNDNRDLVSVYETLIGDDCCDPFEDSEAAVEAFEAADWLPLLKHNLADIQRTHELAMLAERFVPQSDFAMKNLAPPTQ